MEVAYNGTGIDISESLVHYGTPHEGTVPHSGRYAWGSGDDAYQRSKDFQAEISKLRSNGLSEKEIADYYNVTTTVLRSRISNAKNEVRAAEIARAVKLKDEGHSVTEIAARMGKNESSVRAMLNPVAQERVSKTMELSNALKEAVEEQKYIDIGVGAETYLGVSRDKLKKTINVLESEGYKVHYLQTEQVGTGNKTSIMVLTKEGVPYKEVSANRDNIGLASIYGEDNPLTGDKEYNKIEAPRPVDLSRVQVVYGDQGGVEKDGLIELRRGVDDISLGKANYVQARIEVEDMKNHTTDSKGNSDVYLKGMCVYADDLPDGIDIRFNTNKKLEGHENPMDVMKPIKDDPENPFGATIKTDKDLILAQRHYVDENGEVKQSCINVVNEEGNWNDWSKNLSSQFLSKQKPELIKQQLDITLEGKKAEFDEIKQLENPAIQKDYLMSYAEDCDAAAVHLKAAGLPGQASHVILPISSVKEDQIYAPKYEDGTRVALVRYPHGNIVEIPELIVNNKNEEARRILGANPADAVGINHKVAEQLSGADFDGDTVIVIPIKGREITTSKSVSPSSPLQQLKYFDPKERYPKYEGMEVMSERTKQLKMGDVSNLITDMTLGGATEEEMARAIRHSMVVIDAAKHELNWRQSYKDNGIAALKEKYQGGADRGAATLISQASAEKRVPHRTDGVIVVDPVTGSKHKMYIDPDTGEKLYSNTGETYQKILKTNLKDENGKVVTRKDGSIVKAPRTNENGDILTKETPKTTKTTKMAEALRNGSAYDLSSGTVRENLYADYANQLHALANEARKAYLKVPNATYNPEAAKKYESVVKSLLSDIRIAESNAPLERKAQLLANSRIKQWKTNHPYYTNDELKKEKGRELKYARDVTGASKTRIVIDDKKWEAIQAGAVSHNTILKILANADKDSLREKALPRTTKGMTSGKVSYAKRLLSRGYTQAEVAQMCGVSVSTLMRNVNGGN